MTEIADTKKVVNDEFVVNIVNKDDGNTTNIGANNGTKISEIIDEMYSDFKVERKPKDRLTCRNSAGTEVYQFANFTLREYLEKGQCPELKWAFISETGGA